MQDDTLNYGEFLADAMRSVVARALKIAATTGLPNEHHFYITFDTRHPKLLMPAWLYDQYPQNMQIVLQHKFWDLKINEEDFEVTLHFNKKPCPLTIPFEAILDFSDPSVNFSLQFQVARIENDDDDDDVEDNILSSDEVVNEQELDEFFDDIDQKILKKEQEIQAKAKTKSAKKKDKDKDNIIAIDSLRKDSE